MTSRAEWSPGDVGFGARNHTRSHKVKRSPEVAPSGEDSPLILGAIFYENFELLDSYGPLEMFGSIGP